MPNTVKNALRIRWIHLTALLTIAGATLTPRSADGQSVPFALVSRERATAAGQSSNASLRRQAIWFGDQALARAPHAIPTLHIEGSMPHETQFDQGTEAIKDFGAARDLALAGRVSGNAQYYSHAAGIIAAWLAVYQPDFNPIDEAWFVWMIVAYDLLPEQVRNPLIPAMNRFLRGMAQGYVDRFPKLTGGTAVNNWQSHRIVLVTLAAYALGDRRLIEQAKAAFVAHLAKNILPDGSTVDFAERDAVHYVAYDLEPLAMAALAAREHGDDWYHIKNPAGAGLEEALLWLRPYAEGVQTHQEFEHTSVKLDILRRQRGVAGFSGAFDPKDARDSMVAAARLDPRFIQAVRAVQPGSSSVLFNLVWPLPN